MKTVALKTFVSLVVLLPFGPGVARTHCQGTLDGLLARLSEEPLTDQTVLWKIEAQPPDPRTIPSLEQAFAKGKTKQEKQWIAVTLLRLGDRSDTYFDFLAGYVKTAIEDRAPLWEKFDEQGQQVRGQVSADLDNWCAANHKDPKDIVALQFGVYPRDVLTLAQAQDRRAIDLFQQGLASPYPGVVAYSVQGLGRLHILSSIPLISEAAGRLPPGERGAIAAQLPWYAGGEAEQLFDRLTPSLPLRDSWRRMVQTQRDIELKRVLSREGRVPAK
jgi:hypothetical protein